MFLKSDYSYMLWNETKRLAEAEEALDNLNGLKLTLNGQSQIYQIRQTESSIQRQSEIADEAREAIAHWSKYQSGYEVN